MHLSWLLSRTALLPWSTGARPMLWGREQTGMRMIICLSTLVRLGTVMLFVEVEAQTIDDSGLAALMHRTAEHTGSI